MTRGLSNVRRYVAQRMAVYVIALFVFAALVGWLANDWWESGEQPVVTGIDHFPPARSLEELLVTTQVVVTGTYGERTAEVWEYPYDYPRIRSVAGPDVEVEPWPVTYFDFLVDEVIHDEAYGIVSGDTLEIRLGGHDVAGRMLLLADTPRSGDRRLLVLGVNPDGSFGPITLYHSFVIDGSSVRYDAGERNNRDVAFLADDSPQAFVEAIRAELARRGPSPVPPVDFDNLVPRPIAPPPSTQ